MIQLRLLFLLQGREEADHAGWVDGCRLLQAAGLIKEFRVICYSAFAAEHGWPAFYDHVEQTVAEMAANVVLFHYFHIPMTDPSPSIMRLKRRSDPPMIITTSGDPLLHFGRPLPISLVSAARHSDLTLTSAMGRFARRLFQLGAPLVALLPHGMCQVRFPRQAAAPTWKPEFDIVFTGSHLATRNPFTGYAWGARRRWAMVQTLEKRYGHRFALFGEGWQGCRSWQGTVAYAGLQEALLRGRIAVGGYPHGREQYYLSDRPFIAVGSGVPFCEYSLPGIGDILAAGQHWYLYRDDTGLCSIIDTLLGKTDEDRLDWAGRAAAYVRGRHMQSHRMETVAGLARQWLEARERGDSFQIRALPFFLNGIASETVMSMAVIARPADQGGWGR